MKTRRPPLGNSSKGQPFFVASALLLGMVGGRAAVAAPIKVACIGDQMTHSDLYSNSRETQPPGMQEYPRKLQDLMGAGYDVRNFGDCCASVISGYASSETHPYVSGGNYKNAVAFLPDIVIIGPWGRHDWGKSAMTALAAFTVPKFQTGYEDLITKFQALSSKPKIFISSLVALPFGMDGPDNGYKTSPQNDVVLALAAKYNLPVVDLFNTFMGAAAQPWFIQPPAKDSDGEHTSDAGSTKLAMMYAAALMGMGTTVPTGGQSGSVGGSTGNGGSASATGGTNGAGGKGGSAAGTGSGGDTGATGTGGGTIATGTGGTVTPGTGGTVVVSTGGTVPTSTGGALQGTGGVSSGSGGTVASSGGSNSSGSGSGGDSSGATNNDSSSSSCAIGAGGGAQSPWGVLVVVGLFALARRRSRQRAGSADAVR